MTDNQAPKKKLSASQTRKLIPAVEKFNAIAKIFIQHLTRKIEAKEKQLSTISVMVKDAKIPITNHHNISIQTVDINKTIIKKKGQLSYNEKMTWEQDFRQRNKGFIL